jgi:hypothetical protein
MHLRNLLFAILAVVVLTLGLPGVGLADGDSWCDTDPPVLITTPAGNQVVVYVSDGGDATHAYSLIHPSITYTVQSVSSGTQTNVQLIVTIPDDVLGQHYAVQSQVWSGALRTGVLYASQSGKSGQPLSMQFRLAVP